MELARGTRAVDVGDDRAVRTGCARTSASSGVRSWAVMPKACAGAPVASSLAAKTAGSTKIGRRRRNASAMASLGRASTFARCPPDRSSSRRARYVSCYELVRRPRGRAGRPARSTISFIRSCVSGTWRRDTLELHRDRLRLEEADPDRQAPSRPPFSTSCTTGLPTSGSRAVAITLAWLETAAVAAPVEVQVRAIRLDPDVGSPVVQLVEKGGQGREPRLWHSASSRRSK